MQGWRIHGVSFPLQGAKVSQSKALLIITRHYLRLEMWLHLEKNIIVRIKKEVIGNKLNHIITAPRPSNPQKYKILYIRAEFEGVDVAAH